MNNRLAESAKIRDIMKKHSLSFTKSLGQNFLRDIGVVEDIVEASGLSSEDSVLEIGPGIGVMTYAFASNAKKVTTVEIDKHLIPAIKETLSEFDNVTILNEDFLRLDLTAIDPGARIIANLPYYITTPIIMKILEEGYDFKSMTIMMQKEVAQRIVAKPGSKDYGVLSIAVQYYTDASIVLEVPKHSFVPEPNVDSSVVHLVRKQKERKLELTDKAMFFRVVKTAFSTRRKTLLNSLSNGFDKGLASKALEMSGIDSRRRAETLSIEEFGKLSDTFSRLSSKN